MAKKLFVGNLSWNTNDQTLQALFATIGAVTSAQVITDKYTGRSRGFGFVEMSNDEEADRAIAELNGKDLDERQITVNEARPREDRPSGGGGGGYRGGGDRGDRPRRDYDRGGNDNSSGGDMM